MQIDAILSEYGLVHSTRLTFEEQIKLIESKKNEINKISLEQYLLFRDELLNTLFHTGGFTRFTNPKTFTQKLNLSSSEIFFFEHFLVEILIVFRTGSAGAETFPDSGSWKLRRQKPHSRFIPSDAKIIEKFVKKAKQNDFVLSKEIRLLMAFNPEKAITLVTDQVIDELDRLLETINELPLFTQMTVRIKQELDKTLLEGSSPENFFQTKRTS